MYVVRLPFYVDVLLKTTDYGTAGDVILTTGPFKISVVSTPFEVTE